MNKFEIGHGLVVTEAENQPIPTYDSLTVIFNITNQDLVKDAFFLEIPVMLTTLFRFMLTSHFDV